MAIMAGTMAADRQAGMGQSYLGMISEFELKACLQRHTYSNNAMSTFLSQTVSTNRRP